MRSIIFIIFSFFCFFSFHIYGGSHFFLIPIILLLIYRLFNGFRIGEIYILLSPIVFGFYFFYLETGGEKIYQFDDNLIYLIKNQVEIVSIISLIISFIYRFFAAKENVVCIDFETSSALSVFFIIIASSMLMINFYFLFVYGLNSRLVIVENYRIFPYIKFLYIGFSALIFKYFLLNKKFKIIAFTVAVFWILDVLFGSRREFMFLLLYCFFILYFSKKIKSKHVLIGVSVAAIMSLIAYVRNINNENSNILLDAFGEFLFPIQTLIYVFDKNMQGGTNTIFNFFIYLIPKDISGLKMSMAQYISDLMGDPNADFNIGYAFTPLTDIALTFGNYYYLAFPFTVFFISLIFNRFFSVLNILFAASILNFFRAEYATFFIELGIVCSGYIISIFFIKYFCKSI